MKYESETGAGRAIGGVAKHLDGLEKVCKNNANSIVDIDDSIVVKMPHIVSFNDSLIVIQIFQNIKSAAYNDGFITFAEGAKDYADAIYTILSEYARAVAVAENEVGSEVVPEEIKKPTAETVYKEYLENDKIDKEIYKVLDKDIIDKAATPQFNCAGNVINDFKELRSTVERIIRRIESCEYTNINGWDISIDKERINECFDDVYDALIHIDDNGIDAYLNMQFDSGNPNFGICNYRGIINSILNSNGCLFDKLGYFDTAITSNLDPSNIFKCIKKNGENADLVVSIIATAQCTINKYASGGEYSILTHKPGKNEVILEWSTNAIGIEDYDEAMNILYYVPVCDDSPFVATIDKMKCKVLDAYMVLHISDVSNICPDKVIAIKNIGSYVGGTGDNRIEMNYKINKIY